MQHQLHTEQTAHNAHQLPFHRRYKSAPCAHANAAQRCRRTCVLPHRQALQSRYTHMHATRRAPGKSSIRAVNNQGQDDVAGVPTNQQGFRHAILHDFCMSIPFGSIVLAAGVVSLLFGSGRQGLAFAAAGTGVLAASFFSLVQWRAQRPSTVFTLVSAGITAALAWGFWDLVEAGIAAVPNTAMSFLSLAMLTFLIYNIFAGGNPPKKTTAEDDDELAAAAAAA